MPNWTTNELKFKKRKDFDAFVQKYTDGMDFDFNKVIKRPEDLNDTIAGGNIMSCVAYYLFDTIALICSSNDKIATFGELKKMKYNPSFINEEMSITEIKKALSERCWGLRMFDSENITGARKEYTINEIGEYYYRLYKKYGYMDWYEWSCDNWGTKWNATSTNINNTQMIITFDTAWSCPSGIYRKIAEDNPDWDIKIALFYEDGDKYKESIKDGKYIEAG